MAAGGNPPPVDSSAVDSEISLAIKSSQYSGRIRATDHFRELYGHRALRLYQLRGACSRQCEIALSANFRLILQRITEDKVRVLDVEDYHGD